MDDCRTRRIALHLFVFRRHLSVSASCSLWFIMIDFTGVKIIQGVDMTYLCLCMRHWLWLSPRKGGSMMAVKSPRDGIPEGTGFACEWRSGWYIPNIVAYQHPFWNSSGEPPPLTRRLETPAILLDGGDGSPSAVEGIWKKNKKIKNVEEEGAREREREMSGG